jgi:hypothetical protein
LGFFAGASGSYAVNGFKTVMGEPQVVGIMVSEPQPPATLQVVGTYEMGDQVIDAPTKPRKRRGRR